MGVMNNYKEIQSRGLGNRYIRTYVIYTFNRRPVCMYVQIQVHCTQQFCVCTQSSAYARVCEIYS